MPSTQGGPGDAEAAGGPDQATDRGDGHQAEPGDEHEVAALRAGPPGVRAGWVSAVAGRRRRRRAAASRTRHTRIDHGEHEPDPAARPQRPLGAGGRGSRGASRRRTRSPRRRARRRSGARRACPVSRDRTSGSAPRSASVDAWMGSCGAAARIMPGMPRLTAVMLAWRDEPLLVESVHAVLASDGSRGRRGAGRQRLHLGRRRAAVGRGGRDAWSTRATTSASPAAATSAPGTPPAEFLAFVNGDAVVRPDALHHLVAALGDDVGLATASVRLYDEPDVINSAGNPVHFTGLSWAGGLGQPATAYAEQPRGRLRVRRRHGLPRATGSSRWAASASRCSPTARTPSSACGRGSAGWKVVYVPEAVVAAPLRVLAQPAEVLPPRAQPPVPGAHGLRPRPAVRRLPPAARPGAGDLALALRDGWARQKLAGWWWLLRHAGLVRSRRRQVRSERVVSDRELARVLTGDLDFDLPGLTRARAGPARVPGILVHRTPPGVTTNERKEPPCPPPTIRRCSPSTRTGITLAGQQDVVLDVLFDERRIWSFWSQRDTEARRGRRPTLGGLAEAAGAVPRRQHPAHRPRATSPVTTSSTRS